MNCCACNNASAFVAPTGQKTLVTDLLINVCLQALDYVIDSASRHGIRLILSFIDNWKYYNGVDQYVDW
jgi:hypothetical protein